MNIRCLLVGLFLAMLPRLSPGDDYRGEDLSLRFPAALSGFSVYADTAAKGGSSAASKFGSSVNRAALAWTFPEHYDAGLTAQYSNVSFQTGTRLDFLSEGVTFDAHDFGVIRFSYASVRSNDHLLRGAPLAFTYDLNTGRVDWAKRWGAWALGAGLAYAESETTFRGSKLVFADAIRRTTNGQVGILWQPAGHWLLGVTGEYGYAPTHTDLLLPTLAGLARSTERDLARQGVVRTGIAYEWRENALVHFDYQHGHFWNETGSLDVDRLTFGGDLPLARFLFVRAGAVVNVRGDFGWTAGFGFYPRQGVTFDFAYQNDVFPELQREFGHSRTLNASVSVQF